MKKFKILPFILVAAIFLTSCGVSNPFVNTGRSVTETELVDYPEVNSESYGFLGDTLVSKGTKSYTPAIKLTEEWVWKEETSLIPRHWVPAGTEFVLTGVWANNKTGSQYKCYTGTYNYDAHWNYYNVVGTNLPMDLCMDDIGFWHDFQSLLLEGKGIAKDNKPFGAEYEEFTKIEQAGVSFVQEFVYNGRVDNALKFVYREFSGDLARPAFTQEIQYDLDQSRVIGFKMLEIEVLEATNTNIRFKLLRNF